MRLPKANRVTRLNRSRLAFTLVELLVVIFIIGVLIALLLPAVQFAREAARRMSCQSQVKQIALALHQYHDSRSALPPGKSTDRVGNKQIHAFWLLHLLPYVEQDAVVNESEIEFAAQANALRPYPHATQHSVVQLFGCPSDDRVREAQWTHQNRLVGLTSYVGNVGSDYRAKNGVLFADSAVNFGFITDGTSNTLLFGERPPSADFWYGWWYAGFGQNGEGSPDALLGAAEFNDSGVYLAGCAPGPHRFGPGKIRDMCATLHYWSPHPGGANFAMCDGSVRFVDYGAGEGLVKMATRGGGE